MRFHLILLLQFVLGVSMYAQENQDPVVWTHSVEQHTDSTLTIFIEGYIEDGWHVYSQFTDPNGSLPSEFTFYGAGEDFELIGKTEESETQKEYNDIFEVEETFFKKQAGFKQDIKLINKSLSQIDVNLFYQVCKEVCIPKDVTFNISLNGKEAIAETETIDDRSRLLAEALKLDLKQKDRLNSDTTMDSNKKSSLWVIFGLGFLGGLIAILTPCVFPMIPLTVSFFTKHANNGSSGVWQALLYGFFIVFIYFLLSIPFHLFDSVDPQILNTIATNIWLNLGFFLLFVVFAFSFFGYFELTLPSSWSTKMDSISTRVGGGLGIFFMALTLAIVSFSCTGPILGGLLGGTALAEGDVALNLSAGMVGFGVALALPFALFAMFPALLSRLPKSGGWMNTVKVVLGFLELALAFKFLSNADLVGNWGILKREIFIGIWVVLFLLLTLYLLKVYRFPHEGKEAKTSKVRIGLGILSGAFTIYLFLGIFNYSRLKLLSGFPPPDFYSIEQKDNECPLGLDCYKDLNTGVAEAKKTNKPILLDFTGWACVNCRRMEEHVWSDPNIFEILKEEVVLISLYVDDRTKLSEEDQFVFKFDSGNVKKVQTIGTKWGTFQNINFGAISQPYYVMLSPEFEVLNSAIQNSDVETYEAWLRSGLETFDGSGTKGKHTASK